MMPLLLAACPSFQEAWERDLDAEDKELPYVCLGAFANHLLKLHQENKQEEFPAVAKIIERLHTDGDSYVREAATIGLLEGIQNGWANNNTDPEEFFPFLLPRSALWWEQLNLFWAGKIPHVGATIPANPNGTEPVS
jgi:hypothetical protein